MPIKTIEEAIADAIIEISQVEPMRELIIMYPREDPSFEKALVEVVLYAEAAKSFVPGTAPGQKLAVTFVVNESMDRDSIILANNLKGENLTLAQLRDRGLVRVLKRRIQISPPRRKPMIRFRAN